MNDIEELKLAEQIATELHEGQFRRDGITPYIEHPKAVAEKMDQPFLKSVAWLHDTIEDCGIDEAYLIGRGISVLVAHHVNVLSKKDGQSYETYISEIKSEGWARRVKIADMLTNLTDNPTTKQVTKYTEGIMLLV